VYLQGAKSNHLQCAAIASCYWFAIIFIVIINTVMVIVITIILVKSRVSGQKRIDN